MRGDPPTRLRLASLCRFALYHGFKSRAPHSKALLAYSGWANFYSYAFNSPIDARDPSGLSTLNIGGGFNCVILGYATGASAGFITYSNGNIGTYETGNLIGGGVGAGWFFGLTSGVSTAETICGYAGPFVEYSANGGLGGGGGVSGYTGYDSGTPVFGGSVSAGIGGEQTRA